MDEEIEPLSAYLSECLCVYFAGCAFVCVSVCVWGGGGGVVCVCVCVCVCVFVCMHVC